MDSRGSERACVGSQPGRPVVTRENGRRLGKDGSLGSEQGVAKLTIILVPSLLLRQRTVEFVCRVLCLRPHLTEYKLGSRGRLSWP